MARVGEDLGGRARLDDPPGVHHEHPVGDVGHDAEVVGDQDQRHAAALALALEQVEDLRLDRDVQRRRRLVGDQHVGVGGERDRDRDPLAQAAAQLVGIVGAAA